MGIAAILLPVVWTLMALTKYLLKVVYTSFMVQSKFQG